DSSAVLCLGPGDRRADVDRLALVVRLGEEGGGAPPKSAPTVAIEKVNPALVFLQKAKAKGKGKEEGKPSKYALGIIIDPKGTVVANLSAIKGLWPRRYFGGCLGGNHFRNSRPEGGRLGSTRGPVPAILRSRSSSGESEARSHAVGCQPRPVNGYAGTIAAG